MPYDNFFGVLLVSLSSPQTCYGIYFSHILFFLFFSSSDKFLYLSLNSLNYFYNNLLLFLTPQLGFFDNKLNQYFIYYYIETFLPHDKFFDILLAFVSFLQTYYDIYFSHILFFYFFLFQLSFCIYLLLVPLISLFLFLE